VPSDSSITLAEAAERLGVHYMTAYRYVRTGRLAAVKRGQEWTLIERDVEALRRELAGEDGNGSRRSSPSRGRPAYPGRLVDRLLAADEAGAWIVAESALASGMDAEEIYIAVIGPALDEIGAKWERNEITVGDEHQASVIAQRLIGRLGPRFARRGRKRGPVLVGSAPGEHHSIPSAMFGDLLRGRGYRVVDLGADVPIESWIIAATREPRPVAIGLCATAPDNDGNVRRTVRALRQLTEIPIFVGGRAITSEAHARRLGATAYTGSFADAYELIEDLPTRAETGELT
jgi:excisionase family DNA binding protein